MYNVFISTIDFQTEEFYVCIYSGRYSDTVLFHHEGGIDIGDVDAKVRTWSLGNQPKAFSSCFSQFLCTRQLLTTELMTYWWFNFKILKE